MQLPASGYQSFITDTNEVPAFTLNEYPISENGDSTGKTLNTPAIDKLTVNQISDDTAEIGFTIANPPGGKELYVWVILNTGISSTGDMVIYPRSPLFLGMPVDYRNGIRYIENQPERIRAEFNKMKIGIDFDTFRILAYDPEDVIVIDKTYSIQHPDEM